jgi:hypothetical protein
MSLAIKDPAAPVSSPASSNPYGLTQSEIKQVQAWNAMSDDEKGEYLFRERQERDIADYITADDAFRAANSNTVQPLAGGGAVVGGALRPDTLITEGGVEMTVQQAIDVGIFSGDILGKQVEDLR